MSTAEQPPPPSPDGGEEEEKKKKPAPWWKFRFGLKEGAILVALAALYFHGKRRELKQQAAEPLGPTVRRPLDPNRPLDDPTRPMLAGGNMIDRVTVINEIIDEHNQSVQELEWNDFSKINISRREVLEHTGFTEEDYANAIQRHTNGQLNNLMTSLIKRPPVDVDSLREDRGLSHTIQNIRRLSYVAELIKASRLSQKEAVDQELLLQTAQQFAQAVWKDASFLVEASQGNFDDWRMNHALQRLLHLQTLRQHTGLSLEKLGLDKAAVSQLVSMFLKSTWKLVKQNTSGNRNEHVAFVTLMKLADIKLESLPQNIQSEYKNVLAQKIRANYKSIKEDKAAGIPRLFDIDERWENIQWFLKQGDLTPEEAGIDTKEKAWQDLQDPDKRWRGNAVLPPQQIQPETGFKSENENELDIDSRQGSTEQPNQGEQVATTHRSILRRLATGFAKVSEIGPLAKLIANASEIEKKKTGHHCCNGPR